MSVIEGETGVIVIDPLTVRETAAAAFALYCEHRGNRPVTAMIYTHSHIDHFGGVKGIVTEDDVSSGRVPVIAPDGFMRHAVSENVFAGTAMGRRAGYMYGAALAKGPDGQIGSGLGQTVPTGEPTLIAPTIDITHTGQELTIDGVRIEFQVTPGTEAPAEMNFYFPDHRALCTAENTSHTLHNVLTIRGAQVRDAWAWADYLTETVDLWGADLDVVFASHHWPTWGRDEAVGFLAMQRDMYGYLHDQTLRLMNQGYVGAEIAEMLETPPTLEAQWHTHGYYGSVSHNVKAIYQRYMGWYDANPAHLWGHPPIEVAQRYVAAMGGTDAAVSVAQQAYDDGDYRWAVEVLNHVLFTDEHHERARAMQADAFEQLGFGAENGTWRNAFYNGNVPFENGYISEMLLAHGYNTYMVGKWHLIPSSQETGAGRTTAGRSAAASSGSTGSSVVTRASGILIWCTTTTRSSRPRHRRRAITSRRTWSTRRASSWPTPSRSTRTSRSSCTSPPAATHAPHHVPKEWADKYAGKFDDGWDSYRKKTFARQQELGIVPADAELSRHDPDVPEWESLSDDERRLYAREMEVFAGFLAHTDHHIGRLLDFLRKIGEFDNTLIMVVSDNGASAEGGVTGTTNEAQFFNNCPEPVSESLAVIDEIGGPKHFNHYPWGWTWAGNTPFRRWKRETYRGGASDPFIVHWPNGLKAKGEIRNALRAHHRHGADGARPARARGTRDDPRGHAVTDPGGELRAHARRRHRRDPPSHPVLRDARSPLDLPRRLAGGLSVAGTILRGGCGPVGHADLGRHVDHARRDRLGALPRRGGLRREPQRRRGSSRPSHRDDRHLVRRGREVRRDAGRRQWPGPHDRGEAVVGRAPRLLRLLPGHAVGSVLRRPEGAEPSAQHHRRRRHPRGGAEGVLLCQGAAAGGFTLFIQDGRLHYVHNYVAREYFRVTSKDPVPAGSHSLRFEFEPTGRWTSRTGRERRVACSSTSTTRSSARPTHPSRPLRCSTPVR